MIACLRARAVRGAAVVLGVATVALLLTAAPPAARADRTATSEPALLDWLSEMEDHFERNPHLKNEPSSGWKPYNRIKWAAERRFVNGRLPAPGARWAAWEVKRERESGRTPRAGWFEIGPVNLSGRLLDIEFHPTNADIVYIGSASGGLWKSTDGGDTWATTTEELPTLGIGAVAVLPWNPDIVLIGTGEGAGGPAYGVGILKSTDAGATWNPTSLSYAVGGTHGFHVMEVNPTTGTILAGATDGLWRSTDEGDTWTAVKSGGDWYDVKWKPGDPQRVYTVKGEDGSGNGVKFSTDDGVTWNYAGTGQPASYLIGKTKLGVCAADPSVVYANYVHRSTSQTLGVYRSDDDAATWIARNTDLNMTGGQGWYNLTLIVDPDDPDRLVAGGVRLYESDDGGLNFSVTGDGLILGTETAVHLDHHGIAYEPGSTDIVWVATDGGAWRSTNDGRDWHSRREGLATYQFYDICVAQSDPIFMMGGTQDNGVPGRDGTDTWFTSTLMADGMVCNINPNNADAVYAEWQFGNHVKSFNGGQSWFDIMNGITGDGAWVAPVDEDQTTPNHLYTATTAGIFRTTSGGNLWEQVATHRAIWISISLADGDVVWTTHGNGTWVTTDDGASWTQAAAFGLPTDEVTRIHAHPTDVDAAFVTFGGYGVGNAHVALTTDRGASWTDVTGDFPTQPVNVIVVDPAAPDHWYLGTDVGVWASTNGGVNWIPFEVGLPNAVVYDLEIQRTTRKLVAGTHGRGAWEIALPPPASTGVSTAVEPSHPHLMLDPPFPNPVSDGTWLRWAARSSGPVTVDVYDVRGRLVSRVASEPRGDGVIRATRWLTDDVTSGVYFAVLTTGEDQIVRKVVVAR